MRKTDKINNQALQVMEKIEMDAEIYNLKIYDIPVWWFIRVHFYNKLVNYLRDNFGQEQIAYSQEISIRNVIFSCKKICVLFLRMLVGFIRILLYKIKKREILFLVYPTSFNIARNGIENNVSLGPIYRRLKERSVVVETMSLQSNDFYSLLFYKNAIFMDFVFAISFIKNIFKLLEPIKIDNWEAFKEKLNKINLEYVSQKWILDTIEELILSMKNKIVLQTESARIILENLKPKVIVETTSYNSGTLALNFMAKKMGIPVVEIQHGLIPEFEIGYTYFIAPYYVKERPLPDKILLYGEAFKENILKTGNGFSDQDLVVTGYLRMNNFLPKITTEKEAIKSVVRKKLGVKDDDFLITVTSQPGFNIFLVRFLEKVIPLLKKGIFICLKLHPLESVTENSVYKKLSTNSEIKIVNNKDMLDLYDLLIASNVHSTICSTVFLEAMALGIPNIILKLPGYETVLRTVNQGDIMVVDSPEEFVNEVMHLKSDNIYRQMAITQAKQISKKFFADNKNTEEVIVKEIIKCMKNKC